MKITLASLVLGLLLSTAAVAQEPQEQSLRLPAETPSLISSPEIWLYLHEQRRLDDPALAVRRNAERRAEERRDRLAAMKWFGYSNSRPQATCTPFTGHYSPVWAGNGTQGHVWRGVGGLRLAVQVEDEGSQR